MYVRVVLVTCVRYTHHMPCNDTLHTLLTFCSFLSRARTLLVKLRQQVDESTCGALQQGADRLLIYVQQLEEEGMITGGKGGGNAAASGAALAAGGDKGSGGGQKKAGGANAGGTGDSGAGAGKGTGKKDFGEHGCHPVIRGVRELEEVVSFEWVRQV